MTKLTSSQEFIRLQNVILDDADTGKPCIVVCAGTACQASNSNNIQRAVKKIIMQRGLHDRICLRITGCHGFCEMGPFILTEPQNAFYTQLKAENVATIIDKVLVNEYADDLLYRDPVSGEKYYNYMDIPFFKNQQRLILQANQKLDPIRIYNYISQGGYQGLEKALTKYTKAEVIQIVRKSGLRGRGGAGFPTGIKWDLLSQQPGQRGKFLVCNADEGDPGAYMDRSILEGNPHSIIEGMIIAAYATGATEGIVYVRNEYPLAIKHLIIALRQCRDLGFLGTNILGSGLNFDINLVKGAGAFVCGEETALIKSIEGKMGEPVQRPPFPIEKGLEGKPTVINNVETWANIPLIFKLGAEEYAKIGSAGNSGTKIFSLVGKIKNTGLVEVPMGITIGEVVYDIGGGSPNQTKIKAVQTGGPSGGCIPASHFSLPIDYDSLARAGSIMGSGGLIVMDEKTCIVDVAKYFMKFLMDESCGKCFTCRKGTQRMYEILEDITTGVAKLEDLDLLEQLAYVIKDTTMCGLGQSAPNPVLSALRYFRSEFEQHINEKKCKAYICRDLVGAPCQAACPIGTEAWKYIAHIAQGEYEQAYQVIREANPFPSVCARVCSHPCESQCRSGQFGNSPIAIRAMKRFITDQIDPDVYKPQRVADADRELPPVAIVGSGPAGLTAAHYLSLQGYKSTIFEADDRPGGMLVSGIPEYRLPRDTLTKEINSLIDENVTLKCNTKLGVDFTIDSLFDDGFKAVFLAMGAHKSTLINLENENTQGVFSGIHFLKNFNLQGKSLATGNVVVVGGGDSAVDAAGVAIRQKGVKSVTLLYRRTRYEMPAQARDIDMALEEGVKLVTLANPISIFSENGKLIGIKCIKNRLGEIDSSGRRSPIPVPDTEFDLMADTLIVSIGDKPAIDFISTMGINVTNWNTLQIDRETLATNRSGVFAGGDVVTGPNTVVEAIAAGKKAAIMIRRYLNGQQLKQPAVAQLPSVYIAPSPDKIADIEGIKRAEPPTQPAASRRYDFREVESAFSVEDATREACRCLRCDLEFTKPNIPETENNAVAITVGVSSL